MVSLAESMERAKVKKRRASLAKEKVVEESSQRGRINNKLAKTGKGKGKDKGPQDGKERR